MKCLYDELQKIRCSRKEQPSPDICLGCLAGRYILILQHLAQHILRFEVKIRDAICLAECFKRLDEVNEAYRCWIRRNHKEAVEIIIPEVSFEHFFKDKTKRFRV